MGGAGWELKNMDNPVRILIHESANREDVLRLLKKIRKWIKRDTHLLEVKGSYPSFDDDIDDMLF
jgi:hypothetical protein